MTKKCTQRSNGIGKAMRMTMGQKALLACLVNFFGGETTLIRKWEGDPDHKRLHKLGLIRWGRKVFRGSMRQVIATKKGVAVAKRFKKDWSEIWSSLNPVEAE